MTAVSPVVPGLGLDGTEVKFAKDQPQYRVLPALKLADGTVITRWRCSWRDRWRLLWRGDLWLSVLTFQQPLQPVRLDTDCPYEELRTAPRWETERRWGADR